MPDDAYNLSDQTIYATRQIVTGTVHTPFHGIDWPLAKPGAAFITQIQQVKIAGIAGKPNVQTPTSPSGLSPSTQGLPKNLAVLGATKTILSATQAQFKVSFVNNVIDPYFTAARVYLKQGSGNPSIVGQGASSPINVTLNRTSTPSVLIVQASGNWGEIPFSSCPTVAISLI
jgi:hypothetical protein